MERTSDRKGGEIRMEANKDTRYILFLRLLDKSRTYYCYGLVIWLALAYGWDGSGWDGWAFWVSLCRDIHTLLERHGHNTLYNFFGVFFLLWVTWLSHLHLGFSHLFVISPWLFYRRAGIRHPPQYKHLGLKHRTVSKHSLPPESTGSTSVHASNYPRSLFQTNTRIAAGAHVLIAHKTQQFDQPRETGQ
jgi:hypothetical protein